MPTRELRVVITGDAKSLSAALGKSKAELTGFGSSADRIASKLTSAGRTMTHNVTLPIVAAGAAAVKFSYDFETSLSHIQSLVGANSKEMEVYRQSIMRLAPAVGVGPKDLADALYFITSSGYQGAAALKVLEASAKGAASGLGDTKTIADLVTSAVTVYGEKNLSASKAVDVLTQAVRDGKGEPADYATAMGRVIPVAQNLGVTFDQTGAALAALTLGGFSADKATTGLSSIFTNLSKTSKSADAALKKVGLSAAGIRQEIRDKGLLPALMDLNKAFDGNSTKLRQVFTSGKAIVPFLTLTGQAAGTTAKVFNDLANSTGASAKAFSTQSKTTTFEVQQSWATLQTDLVSAGSIILPVVASIGHDVAGLVHEFSQMPAAGQKVTLLGVGIIAALGPAMSMIGNATKAVRGLSLAVVALSANPLIAIGLLAAAVVTAAIVISSRNQEVGKSFADVRHEIQQTTDAFQKWHDASLAEKNASLQVKRANLELAQTTLQLNTLTREGKKGTLEWRTAYLNHRQAVLDVLGAQEQLKTSTQQTAKAEAKARDQVKRATEDYNTTLDRAGRLLKLYSAKSTDITDKQRLLREVTSLLSGDMNKNAAAFDAAAAKIDKINPKLAASYRHAADVARAVRDLAGQLDRLPTTKEINIQIAVTKTEHVVDVGRHHPYKSKATNATGTPYLGGDGVSVINEKGPELLTAPDGSSALLVKMQPGTRVTRAADTHIGGDTYNVTQIFPGQHLSPAELQAQAIWNLRRLRPQAVTR